MKDKIKTEKINFPMLIVGGIIILVSIWIKDVIFNKYWAGIISASLVILGIYISFKSRRAV